MTEEVDNQQFKEAWDRIARTPDGRLAYLHLTKIRFGLTPASAPKRALPMNEGRRSLAADLMAYMAEGIADSDRTCITFAVAKPVAVTGDARRPGGRRINADTFVSGYDGPRDAIDAGAEPGNGTTS